MIIASDSEHTLDGYSVVEHNNMLIEILKVVAVTKTTKQRLIAYADGNLRHFQHLYLGENGAGLPKSVLMLHCMKLIDGAARSRWQKFTSVLYCWIDEYGELRHINKPLRWQKNFISLGEFATIDDSFPF